MAKRIFLSPPHMSGHEMAYIQRAFDENYITSLGSNVTEFEEKIRTITGTPNSLALINATSAIHLALRILDVQDNDEIFASTFTFIGSVAPILYQNAKPFFIDSDTESWNMDPSLLEAELSQRKNLGDPLPKAVILTHLYGQMARVDEILAICNTYGIPLIEDAAESLGATLHGVHSGTFGRFGVYSFNGNKILTTSGGGFLIGKHKEEIDRARFLSTQAKDDAPHYEHTTYGYNYRMSNILAGVGIAQLDVLDERIERKREIFSYYEKHLGHFPGIAFMPEIAGSFGNRWLTTVTFKDFDTREKVRLALEKENIESRPLWKPMHLQPVFEGCGYRDNGVSEKLFENGLCLPSGTAMDEKALERIVSVITKNI